eukprot:scaffold1372_cov351-Pavlova_lutheri.AAC.16
MLNRSENGYKHVDRTVVEADKLTSALAVTYTASSHAFDGAKGRMVESSQVPFHGLDLIGGESFHGPCGQGKAGQPSVVLDLDHVPAEGVHLFPGDFHHLV